MASLRVFMAFIIIGFLSYSCKNPKQTKIIQSPQKVPTLVVGIQNSPSNALVILADAKKLFDSTKIKVQVKEFTAGKLALQALLGNTNDVQVAVSAETPVVLSTLGGNKPIVLGSIVDAKNECRMVVRRDGALDKPETYFKKKRVITTSQGGSPEWLTYNFFKKYKISSDQVEIVAMAPENMPTAVASKAVDGCCIFDPFARFAENELGDKGITFLNTDMKSYYVLSVKENTYKQEKEALAELLIGLKRAEEFIKKDPDAAKAIIAQRTKIDAKVVMETWSNYNFSLQMDENLSALCEVLAKWAIETGKYPTNTPIPNFDTILNTSILKLSITKQPNLVN